VISIVFSIIALSQFYQCFRNLFDIENKVFFPQFGMANPNPSTFLSNIEWNLAKQLENGDFYGFFHNVTNLFWNIQMLQGICLTYRIKYFPSVLVKNRKFIIILSNVQWKVVKHLINSGFYSVFHNSTITVSLFETLKMLPGMCLKCTIKCGPLILVLWTI